MKLDKLVYGLMTAGLMAAALPVQAQTAKDFEDMRAELKALRAEREALRAALAELWFLDAPPHAAVHEAVALVEGGVTDVLVSNEVIHPQKLARLVALTDRAQIGICVDSDLGLDRLIDAAAGAASPIDAYVELEVGGNRCGVTDLADGLALARRNAASNVLRFGGIHAYRGSAQHLRTPAERKAAIDAAVARSADFAAELARAGIDVPVVTGAGTGTFTNEAASGVYNEIQPGSYVFMDRDYADNLADAVAPRFGHSLFVLTSVMSRRDAFAVIDALSSVISRKKRTASGRSHSFQPLVVNLLASCVL